MSARIGRPTNYLIAVTFNTRQTWYLREATPVPWWRRLLIRLVFGGEWRTS